MTDDGMLTELEEVKIAEGLALLGEAAFRLARAKGWYDVTRTDLEEMCLIHTEISEAVECLRQGENAQGAGCRSGTAGKPEGVVVEMADVLLRTVAYAFRRSMRLSEAVSVKHAFNSTRPYRHGKVL